MAATVVLYEYTGAGGSTTSANKFGGSIVHRAADIASETTPGSNPVVKSAGTVWSMERHTRMIFTTQGGAVSITNPTFFTAGSTWGLGITPYAKTATSPTMATPVTPSATTGYTATSTLLTGARKSLGTYTVTTAGASAFVGDYLITMVQIANNATAGSQGNETWTWAYDEA